ncbi:hypothetical protein K6W16_21670 [Burkholderia dolosa]|uniref:Uncharacterized protein n=1 Tax=Burkholderia dolosa TaxID=152500 RepID=A0A892IAU7_9BURK|nr:MULTISPECIES: hypothetical protein [Burkholderia]MBR8058003.1 hypothetical protein [Burkholderia dolosa]MBR8420665.1 hypothetical protein [Burkholderia dolosa]MBY4660616.1 hypothetical protein [Burkholderia dolosa]MBY4691990.1 hypothetical protein [Burkholderia dolosa]MBY4784645.1 hypothetical protein [Burkholderia dolosa]
MDEFTGKRQPRRLLERHDGSMIRMTKRVAAAAARIAGAGGQLRSGAGAVHSSAAELLVVT